MFLTSVPVTLPVLMGSQPPRAFLQVGRALLLLNLGMSGSFSPL